MEIKEINEKTLWDSFFNTCGSPSFLQSWEWGELQKKLGYEVSRLGVYHKSELISIAQVIKIMSKRGNFLFIPHGPIVKFPILNSRFPIKPIISQFLDFLISEAKQKDFSFIRIAPILEYSSENRKLFYDLGFKKAPIYMHAERVWVLDLTKTEKELLASMRKTTRYLIRKAERDGVKIVKRTDEQAILDFYKVYEETAKREKFVAFSKNFISEEFSSFHQSKSALFLIGTVPKGQNQHRGVFGTLAASLLIFTKSSAFYHQGASIHTKIPVPYLMQWEAIKEAKRRGCLTYNFWGILQPGRSPKNWQGLTMFKQGFGGRQIDYVPTQDYILSPQYYFTYLYEKYLGWRRGV